MNPAIPATFHHRITSRPAPPLGAHAHRLHDLGIRRAAVRAARVADELRRLQQGDGYARLMAEIGGIVTSEKGAQTAYDRIERSLR